MKKEIKPSKQVIENALLKKAIGYDCDEIIEEYVIDDEGNAKLSKKKITKKHISPDIPAAKILLEQYANENLDSKFENMTDEQLKQENIKLLKLLKNKGENDAN